MILKSLANARINFGMSKEEFLEADGWEMKAYQEEFERQQEVIDRRFALICCIMAEVNRDTKKRNRSFTVEDFMPKREPTKTDLMKKIRRFQTYLGVIDGNKDR